jgi:hypothetical protein
MNPFQNLLSFTKAAYCQSKKSEMLGGIALAMATSISAFADGKTQFAVGMRF